MEKQEKFWGIDDAYWPFSRKIIAWHLVSRIFNKTNRAILSFITLTGYPDSRNECIEMKRFVIKLLTIDQQFFGANAYRTDTVSIRFRPNSKII